MSPTRPLHRPAARRHALRCTAIASAALAAILLDGLRQMKK
jgi:hypothetical protein